MESLVPVMLSGDDVAVGVSGFGSAAIDLSRWSDLSLLTGRTTFQLTYDSQRMPWAGAGPVAGVAASPFGPLPAILGAAEMYRRWGLARAGASAAAGHLSTWISRWRRADRSVLLVGFSLGSFLIWEAMRGVPRDLWPGIDVVFVSGAVADRPGQWDGVERLSSLTNAYSASDLVLNWLYPRAVDSIDALAVGLGPIEEDCPNVMNIDLTDTIGRDHLWAGDHLPSILRTVLGVSWASDRPARPDPCVRGVTGELTAGAVDRLSAWCISVPHLWDLLGLAMSGDRDAIDRALTLDRWATSASRLTALVDVGMTVGCLSSAGGPAGCRGTAARSMAKLEGLVRGWMDRTLR